jgi:hypothetical protein
MAIRGLARRNMQTGGLAYARVPGKSRVR